MLVALNTNKERVYADEVNRRTKDGELIPYFCPDCGARLTLRKGAVRLHHFSHKEGNDVCIYRKSGGESIYHDQMKASIKRIIERDNKVLKSELEWRIGNRVADYYFRIKDEWDNICPVAVECVYAHEDITEFRKKTEYYDRRGIYVLWVFNLKRFLDKDGDFKEEININSILKEAHTLYFGKVFAIDVENDVIYAIHFNPIKREIDTYTKINWDAWDGESDPEDYAETVGGGYRYLKSKKSLRIAYNTEFKIDSFSVKRRDKFLPYDRRIAAPYIKKFW